MPVRAASTTTADSSSGAIRRQQDTAIDPASASVLDFDALYKAGTLECGDWSENCGRDDSLVGPRGDGWWTGLRPEQCPGYVQSIDGDGRGALASLPLPRATASRQELLDYFDNTWCLTEVLFASLQPVPQIHVRTEHLCAPSCVCGPSVQ